MLLFGIEPCSSAFSLLLAWFSVSFRSSGSLTVSWSSLAMVSSSTLTMWEKKIKIIKTNLFVLYEQVDLFYSMYLVLDDRHHHHHLHVDQHHPWVSSLYKYKREINIFISKVYSHERNVKSEI